MNKHIVKLAEDTISAEELLQLTDWINSKVQLTKGPLTKEFEKQFAAYMGARYSVMVNSGSSANLLMAYALLEGGYLKNKKVVVPAISWVTTLSPFMQLGFEPFLCDSDKNNLGVDIEHLERIFQKENPALLIIVQVLGHANHMDEIMALCEKYGVLLIEDGCEALGSEYRQKKLGTLGKAGSFSFYYGHHISTIEGGIVVTDDEDLYNLMLSIRSHGWARDVSEAYASQWKESYHIDSFRDLYTFYYPGFNLRSTDLNAFLGIGQLKKLDAIAQIRSENYQHFVKYLGDKYWVQKSDASFLSHFAYGTLVENRMEVAEHLKKNGIETRPLICGSMGLQPFWIKKYGTCSLPVADIVHHYGLYLPNHANLNEERIKYVCDTFAEVAIPKHFD